jgi:hypothetical protein
MKQAPWWAPRGYTSGASGRTYGVCWSIAVGRRLPTIVQFDGRQVKIEFPWWARGTTHRAAHVRALIRGGVLQ